MQRPHPTLSVLILTWLLIGCAGIPAVQANDIPSTTPPEKAEPTSVSRVVSNNPPADCPVTAPQDPPYVPPEPYSPNSPFPESFWYGTNSLWTLLPQSGMWTGLPHSSHGYGQKVFWWRGGYIWNEEPEPQIAVTAERLDAPAPLFHSSVGTNAYDSDIGSAMLTGVTFPSLGCWKVTGEYRDAELRFVVWIAP